jgi:hypothetical protein
MSAERPLMPQLVELLGISETITGHDTAGVLGRGCKWLLGTG